MWVPIKLLALSSNCTLLLQQYPLTKRTRSFSFKNLCFSFSAHGNMDSCCLKGVLLFLILLGSASLVPAITREHSTAQVPRSWTNNDLSSFLVTLYKTKVILLKRTLNYTFCCGFFYMATTSSKPSYAFAIFLVPSSSRLNPDTITIQDVRVVWSANRNRPVTENATLQLTQDRGLVLQDADGSLVWSTNISRKSVSSMRLSETGNLELIDEHNTTVWQSFDHPTDTLLPGQKLVEGQRLVARTKALNLWMLDLTESVYSFTVTPKGVFAYIQSGIPRLYYKFLAQGTKLGSQPSYVRFMNGRLALYLESAEPDEPDAVIPESEVSTTAFMRLDWDGHLKTYQWDPKNRWTAVSDLLADSLGKCGYPEVCGSLGICSGGRCYCPGGSPKDNISTTGGCSQISPSSCQKPESYTLQPLENVHYFNYVDDDAADFKGIDAETCRQACLKNCSCQVALFQYKSDLSVGNCFLPSPVLSLISDERETISYKSAAFLKIPKRPSSPLKKTLRRTVKVWGSGLALFLAAVIVLVIWFAVIRRRKNAYREDDCFENMQGIPNRFTYEELKEATQDFRSKLGEGGFGSVFEGILVNGMKIAVKRLESINQGRKEFLAEVISIGSIHHVNLVRLIGFCVEKSHKLLVYEYMCNGSLDKWIFQRGQEPTLDWQTTRRIIVDVAKGLAYLHEGCSQKVVHLDIKPQNILLDKNLSAKVSDFGLSKLIDREETQVMTTIRGTPGYMAPEWLSSMITEKVDVYSFGVVVMETICGRRNLDRTQSAENVHLLSLLKKKAEEDRLQDMVVKDSDMQLHLQEVVMVIRTAIWCLQNDFARRPSMSVVVKVLEGSTDIESDLDYTFWTPVWAPPQTMLQGQPDSSASSQLFPSVLSGPR